ncbi:MAG: hypothetical protein CME06_14095 [Gemmatimonadetes bacterium]|nr:hypothetical protein [Gemmatimonadota bacterium]
MGATSIRTSSATLAVCALFAVGEGSPKALTHCVPGDFPEIGSALNAANSGDTLSLSLAGSPFGEALVIDADRLDTLTIIGEPVELRPVISGDGTEAAIITIEAGSGAPARLSLLDLTLNGYDTAEFGILANTSRTWDEEPLLELRMERVSIFSCEFGMQLGRRTGAIGCTENWGSVNYNKLEQARNLIRFKNCTIGDCGLDGLNMYRVNGEIDGCLFAHNGDEGVHTTAAKQFEIRHTIFIENKDVGVHFQLGEDIRFENNLVLTTGRLGYGISIEGLLGGEAARIHNNVIGRNNSSGLKISPCSLKYDEDNCVAVPASARVHNNIFAFNGIGPPGTGTREDLHFRSDGFPGMQLIARHNLFEDRAHASNAQLDETNLLGVGPGFVLGHEFKQLTALWNPDETDPLEVARSLVFDLSLADNSTAIDAGEDSLRFEDGGGYARGTTRNDIGAFGGPLSDWGIEP